MKNDKPLVSAKVKEGEKIVNVPSLEPRLKHPTIFNTFDELKPGESFIIHNDHDPKPVYYQLLGERGDIFTWEYLEQGPQFWDIRVTLRGEEQQETIGQIAAKDLRKAEVFKKYGIDFCCGGKKTVREVCAEKGIDAEMVERELNQPIANVTNSNMNFTEWNIDFLADYVVNTHHNFVRKYLPEITAYAKKVAQVHGGQHPELYDINTLVENVNAELTEHMVDEENILFPRVKEIVNAQKNKLPYPMEGREALETLIDETEKEHDSVGRAMEEIRRLSNNYAIPSDACASYTLLFKMLEEFESDLFIHIHLENNIMFPKAIELEKTLF
ncbi:MAG: iron-sulfur cluster repair di-iron protein [Bacteroidetes bacterium]|nr:iron-sulfur cluster repair di-iron protein [Bacteroidota bacterium]